MSWNEGLFSANSCQHSFNSETRGGGQFFGISGLPPFET